MDTPVLTDTRDALDASVTFLHLDSEAELLRAFDVMQELRPKLTDAAAFAAQVVRQHAQGYRLLAACAADGTVIGLAGYRRQTNLLYGNFIYVDDLVVTASLHRGGLGARLLDAVREIAREDGRAHFILDTGLHMQLAQRFYFRNGLLATGMHFVQPLTGGAQ